MKWDFMHFKLNVEMKKRLDEMRKEKKRNLKKERERNPFTQNF